MRHLFCICKHFALYLPKALLSLASKRSAATTKYGQGEQTSTYILYLHLFWSNALERFYIIWERLNLESKTLIMLRGVLLERYFDLVNNIQCGSLQILRIRKPLVVFYLRSPISRPFHLKWP